MVVKKVNIRSDIPKSVKRTAMVFKEVVKIYECDTIKSIITMAQRLPLELMLIAETNDHGTPEKFFLIGLAIPNNLDKFKDPLLYFAPVGSDQYDKINDLVERYKTDKSVLYGPDGVKLGEQ